MKSRPPLLASRWRHRSIARSTAPLRRIDLEKIALGEYAENIFRKAFTPSEPADIADALESVERASAKGRQGERSD